MNKNFLITGASSGLGEKFSILISDIAKKIVIVGRKRDKLLKLKKEINKNNKLVKVFIIIADLSKKSGTLKLIQSLQKNTQIQSIDVLVNSAAKFTVKKIENISIKDLDSDFQLNVISPFILSKYIGLKMKKCWVWLAMSICLLVTCSSYTKRFPTSTHWVSPIYI